jgi:hypothetical protein
MVKNGENQRKGGIGSSNRIYLTIVPFCSSFLPMYFGFSPTTNP